MSRTQHAYSLHGFTNKMVLIWKESKWQIYEAVLERNSQGLWRTDTQFPGDNPFSFMGRDIMSSVNSCLLYFSLFQDVGTGIIHTRSLPVIVQLSSAMSLLTVIITVANLRMYEVIGQFHLLVEWTFGIWSNWFIRNS